MGSGHGWLARPCRGFLWQLESVLQRVSTLPWHIGLNEAFRGIVHKTGGVTPFGLSLHVAIGLLFCQFAQHLAAYELPDHERQALAIGHGVFPLGHTGDAVVK